VFDAETASGRPLDAALVRELVTERMHLLPTFRWRLAPVPFGLDHPYWVDDGTFDVEYHVRDAALPAPGTQRQLADLVAHLIDGSWIAPVRCGSSTSSRVWRTARWRC
jgi:diacylglycerol O-acyltransferase